MKYKGLKKKASCIIERNLCEKYLTKFYKMQPRLLFFFQQNKTAIKPLNFALAFFIY